MAIAASLERVGMLGATGRPRSLYMNGLDVLTSPAQRYGVEPRTIAVHEAGPGQVSSISFEITDEQQQVTVSPGMTIRYWDNVLNLPIFTGFVESYRIRRLGTGRTIIVTGIGIEAVLDWMYVPTFTLPAFSDLNAGFQSIVSAAVGIGVPLNAAVDPSFVLSSVATPIGINAAGDIFVAVTITGGSLRQALTQFGQFVISDVPVVTGNVLAVSIDFYGGVRIWTYNPGTFQNTLNDDAGIDLKSTGAFPRPGDTDYGVNASGTPRNVFVIGSGAGTGIVGDGTGIPGPTVVLQEASSTTAERRFALAATVLAEGNYAISGTVRAEGTVNMGTFGGQKRAGCFLTLADDGLGLPSPGSKFFVQAIDKRFADSGEEIWTLHFGGQLPRASQYLRTLTRATLS